MKLSTIGGDLLFGHPGVDEQIGVAGFALVERGVDVGDVALRDDRQAGIARRAGLHGDDGVDLLLEDQGIEGLLRAGRTGGVVGDLQGELPAEHAASGIDLVDRQFGGLHD